MLTHLVSQNIIPPLSPPLKHYEHPDRDVVLTYMEGQKKNTIPDEAATAEGTKERKKRKGSKSDDSAEDGGSVPLANSPDGTDKPRNPPSSEITVPQPMQSHPEQSLHQLPNTLFPSYSAHDIVSNQPLPSINSQMFSPTSSSARLGPTQQSFSLPPLHSDFTQTVQDQRVTPTSLQNQSPTSGISSSPPQPTLPQSDAARQITSSVPPEHAGVTHVPTQEEYQPQSQAGDYAQSGTQRHLTSSMRDEPIKSQYEVEGEYEDENGMEIILGSKDPRQDIIKKNIVENRDALVLVN